MSSIKALKSNLNKLKKAKSVEDALCLRLEQSLSAFVDFEFFVSWQNSDQCYMIVFDRSNARVSTCIGIIEEKGVLSLDDYLNEVL